jgi:8-oxo-dGTP diphosphatase
MEEQRLRVGIGVMIFKESKVLLGKRKGPRGGGCYAWPGGHLDFGESMIECAKRETREETNIEIDNVRFLRLLNLQDGGRHYADIAFIADWKNGEPKLMEPEKCEGWDWYDINHLPQPLWITIPSYFDALKTGRNFYDSP